MERGDDALGSESLQAKGDCVNFFYVGPAFLQPRAWLSDNNHSFVGLEKEYGKV